MLAVASILFVLGSAIVALQGWPRIATQNSPAPVQMNAAPASPSRVSRRLRAVALPPAVLAAGAAIARGGARSATPARVSTGRIDRAWTGRRGPDEGRRGRR